MTDYLVNEPPTKRPRLDPVQRPTSVSVSFGDQMRQRPCDVRPTITIDSGTASPPPPDSPDSAGKQWHRSIKSADRQQFVRKLVRALFPTLDIEEELDARMQPVVEYARKLEGETFEKANSSSEYCHVLAEIVCKVQCTRGKLPESQESTVTHSVTISKS